MTPMRPRELIHFLLLSPQEQVATVKRMALTGWSIEEIAAATRINVRTVRSMIGEPK